MAFFERRKKQEEDIRKEMTASGIKTYQRNKTMQDVKRPQINQNFDRGYHITMQSLSLLALGTPISSKVLGPLPGSWPLDFDG